MLVPRKFVPAVVILFHPVKLLFVSVLRTGHGLVVSLLRILFTLLMLFVIYALRSVFCASTFSISASCCLTNRFSYVRHLEVAQSHRGSLTTPG